MLWCRATLLVVAAVMLAAHPAMGKGGKEAAEAKEHVEKAGRHFDLDEFGAALEEYKEAYRLKADPALLFNIARCHHKLGQREDAAAFYGKYLSKAKAAAKGGPVPREELVHKWLAELESTADGGAGGPDAGTAKTAAAPAAPAAPGPTAHRRFTVMAQAAASERGLARQSREAVEQAMVRAGHELVPWTALADADARVLGAAPRPNDPAWGQAMARAKLDEVVLCTAHNAGLLVGLAKRQYTVDVGTYDRTGARTHRFTIELGRPSLDEGVRADLARALK